MSERVSTTREFQSPPDIDQPPFPAVPVAVTASLKVTVISLRAVASADSTVGLTASETSMLVAEASSFAVPAASSATSPAEES